MPANAKSVRAPRGLPLSYVGMWLLLLSLSVLYLAGVGLKPELMAQMLPPLHVVEPEGNEGQRSASRAVAEADVLRAELERSKVELAEARAELAARTDGARPDAAAQPAATMQQPAVAEPAAQPENPAEAAKTVARGAADKSKAGRQAASAAKQAAQAKAAEQSRKLPGRLADADATAAGAQITTGSIAIPATAVAASPGFGPAIVKPAPAEPAGPQGVQLASGPSLDALRLSWLLLTERHGASLKGLQPRYVTGNDPTGKAYDLIAGPLASPDDAQRVCAALRAKKVACAVSPYSGNAL